jgi:hypothetical protein
MYNKNNHLHIITWLLIPLFWVHDIRNSTVPIAQIVMRFTFIILALYILRTFS